MRISLVILLMLFACTLSAQKTTLRIRIIDTDSLKPIPFASISNQKGLAYLSDENGAIIVDWNMKDTMIVRALGYAPRYLNLEGYNTNILIRIELKALAYELPSATIKGISNKEELKQAILRMRIKENPYADIKGTNFYKGPFLPAKPTLQNPISLIYSTDWAKRRRSKKWSQNLIIPQIK